MSSGGWEGVSARSGLISPDGMVMSSGGWGGGCQPAQDYISSFFVFSFFSLSAFLLFSYLAAENILFHPVKTILDYSITFLGSPHITHAHFLKKCDQFCQK